jgi:hypothetical protein
LCIAANYFLCLSLCSVALIRDSWLSQITPDEWRRGQAATSENETMTFTNSSSINIMLMHLSFARDYHACGLIMEARGMLRAMLSIANRDMPSLRPAIFRAMNRMRVAS